MITALLERLFYGRHDVASRSKVKQRLKFILAHDRAALTPQMFEDMRKEIMAVVSKYVELDEDALSIDLESNQRITSVTANLPIRSIREETPVEAPPIEFEQLAFELDGEIFSELAEPLELVELVELVEPVDPNSQTEVL